ncbi:hypothetical protein ACH4TV_24870 [Streptomyces sp. NPDC020898]|uniref:hypothetical protein n=1 Tax=Streptomyces sp. NPDC020898 TaxID=3365101 RepID=UPI003799EDE3
MQRAALTLTVTALSLAALTACSGGDGNTNTADKPTAPASASQAKQLGPAERLAQLLVTKAEAVDYTVREPAEGEALAQSQDDMSVDKPDCAPLAYAMNELPVGDPKASLVRVANGPDSMFTLITLATYADGKAEAAMKGLTAAADSCGGGYTAKSTSGATTTYGSVTVETAPAGGDESLATAATFQHQGVTQTLRTQTFRFGDTIANYFSLDSGSLVQGRQGQAKIPAALVKAQNAKLA